MSGVAYRCPQDGMPLPEAGRYKASGAKLVRLFWCRYCEAGGAIVGEGDSARYVATVRVDPRTQRYEAHQHLGTQRDFDAVIQALRSGKFPRLGS